MYKGWIYDIQGSPNNNYFKVMIKPDPFAIIEIAKQIAKEEQDDIIQKQWSTKSSFQLPSDIINKYGDYLGNEGLYKLTKKWAFKFDNIKIEKNFYKPSSFFTQYSQRLKDVEFEVKKYIDSDLHDFLTWLRNNCNKI